MARARTNVARHKRVRRTLTAAKGYWGGRHRLYRTAKEAVLSAGVDAYRGRKQKKVDYRRLWITRLTAALRARGFSYSRFIGGLKKANIALNRKVLSELAIGDVRAFDRIVEMALQKA
ncbi:MAG: 50S ribosomal protein L20 [Planctomycetes bacterium]|nr:50S ribosomal protein L20 [Planctomycetota bacterium]